MAVDRRWSARFKEDDDQVDRILSQGKRPTISTVTLPGCEGFRNTVAVSTRSLMASAASESPAFKPFNKAS
jgi:hypothetical protein